MMWVHMDIEGDFDCASFQEQRDTSKEGRVRLPDWYANTETSMR